jgi:surface polysaccharide O-acyltransferase-like enzyme
MLAVPEHTSKKDASTREYGLDWLRVFAFALLILYHSGMGYVTWTWHVKNPETSPALEYVMLACNRWRLPLLFLISGAGVYFSLRRRGFGQFARERLRRLLLPIVFAMLVVVPPQIYFERLYRGAQMSYAEFYPSVFEFVPYPDGSFSWHHLWFVVYILVFSLVGIPLFAFLRGPLGRRAVQGLVAFFERVPPAIYLINVPNIIVSVVLGPRWPNTNNLVSDWANLTGTFLTFLWGFTIASNRDFLDVITNRRKEFAIAGLAIAAVFFWMRVTQVAAGWAPEARLWVGTLISAYYGMTWVFALIGYARTYFNRPSPGLTYATEIVYPFYIVHQTITVAAVYYLIPVPLGVWPKFCIAAFVTVAGSWLVVELIRRSRILRPLFGLKT